MYICQLKAVKGRLTVHPSIIQYFVLIIFMCIANSVFKKRVFGTYYSNILLKGSTSKHASMCVLWCVYAGTYTIHVSTYHYGFTNSDGIFE